METLSFSATINVTNASSVVEKWKLELKFVKFFLQELWETYFRLNGGSLLQPDAPPRIKRLLNLGQKSPEIYKVITEDKVRWGFVPLHCSLSCWLFPCREAQI